MTNRHFRNTLLFGAPIGMASLIASVLTQNSFFSYLGFGLLFGGLIGSFLHVQPKWGKYETFWCAVALEGKNYPIHFFGQGIVAMFTAALFTGYASIAQSQLPGFASLTPWYVPMCLTACALTIFMLVRHIKSYPEWRSIIQYSERRVKEDKSALA
jgi:hypothetical protein